MLLLILTASCTKEPPLQDNCNPCKSPDWQTFYQVPINNWTRQANGSYQSDLIQIMNGYSKSYNSIYQVEVVDEPNHYDLQPGSDVDIYFGNLAFTGNALIYGGDSHSGEHGLPPAISSIRLNITLLMEGTK